MRKFHEALTADAPRVDALRDKFTEVKKTFEGIEEFSTFAEELKKQTEELSKNWRYKLEVDFSAYDPSNYFRSLRVNPVQDGEVRTFEELGTGQEQILALSFAYAYAKAFHGQGDGLVLVIEEPEAHLHPLAQQWMGQKIQEFAGIDGIQVVIMSNGYAELFA